MWKDIINYENNYQISDNGQIRSLKFNKIKNLKPSSNGNYLFVMLYKNGIGKCYYIHRLVAETFLSNEQNYPQINHKDGNKINNNISNLEWVTIKDNNQHAFDIGLKTIWNKGKFGQNTSRSKIILQYSLDNTLIAEYGSIREAGRQLNISSSAISAVCKGKKNTCKGFVWRYKND